MNFLATIRNLYPVNDLDAAEMPIGPDDHIPSGVNINDAMEIDMEEKYNV